MTFATSQSAAPEFISLDDIEVVSQSEWLAALTEAGSTDTYMQLGYHRASAALEPCPAYPVLVRARMGDACVVLPLLVRPLPDGNGFDATSAYGYGGVIASAPFDGEAFGAQFDAWARANTIIVTFLRSHPLLENHEAVPPQAHDIALGATVAWQLDPDKALLESMHSHHRRAVRKADRAGVEVSVEAASHASLARFRVLYDETMRRQEAASFYFFPDAYWNGLLQELEEQLVLVEAWLEGEVVAALLCFAHGDWLHYHLGASADAARNIGASNRCFLAAATWAQARGMTCFHLGGGVGAGTDSPLFQFKHRYDPTSRPHPFHIAKIVHDAGAYERVAGTSSIEGYFPPWRAPEGE